MKRWKKAALITSGIVLLLAGFVAFELPGIVKNQAVQKLETATGRKLAIGGISINPFAWTIEVRDFRFSEEGGGDTFAAFSSARIALSPLSLYRRAPIIAAARINSPHLRIVRVGANCYNFSDLLKWLPLHPRLSVNNLTITNGSIDFIDQGLPVEKRHELRKVELAVPFITTIPYLADRYINPRLSAVVNGSPLHLEGKLRPFPNAVEASVALELKEVSLPYYLAYVPGALPIRVESGRASAKVAVNYRAAQMENPELALNGSVTLADIKIVDRTGAPFLALTRLDTGITRARLLAEEFELSALSADGLEVFLSRDKKGVWSHSQLAGEVSPGAAPRRKALVSVTETRLRNGRFHFIDSLPPRGFTTDLGEISLDMRDYSTSPGKRASYALSFTTLRGEKGSLKGEFSPLPLATSSSIELTGVTLEAYYPYLASVLRPKVKGRLDVAANLDYGGPDGMRLEKVAIQGRQLSAPFEKGEEITLASLSLAGGRFSQKENLLEAADVTLRDGDLRFSRDRKGALLPLTHLYEGGMGATHGEKAATPPLRYRIGRISGSGMNAVFTDEMPAERLSFAFKKIAFSLEKLTGPPFGPIPFRVAATYGKGGSLRASGSVTPAPWKLKGEVAMQRIPLTDFAPYFPKNLNMVVADGKVDARLAVSLAARGDHLTGTFGGSAGIRSLYCLDAEGEDLLRWESLQLDRMKGNLDPFALDIGDVALTRFYSRIIVEKDGSLNLQHLYTRDPDGEEKETTAGGKGRMVRIGTVVMQDGSLVFTDRHVMGGYTTTLFNLGGRVSGLSSEEDRFADVDLRGNLQNQSPLRITGRINPLRDELFADLKVSFTDIELSPMTPYSGTYLGYAVDKGKLFLDSNYRIENRKLDSENRVFIDQLDFGKRIESDKATNLPIRLAVALLKDRKGEIRLVLPVTGRTDDPQFSVWRVVRDILKNLVVTAANSPFTLLQSMFGVKEDLRSVGFAYGSAELSLGEREKLLKLATVLSDRPALKIEVVGFVDRERDDEGLRNELLLEKMRAEKFLSMVKKKNHPGDSPESMQISREEYVRYLKAVYAKEEFPKPRNILGLIKAIPDEEMKKLILANTVVGEQQLRSLAEARAAGVKAFLVNQGKMDSARVFQKSGDMYRAPARGGEPVSRVEFEVGVE
ncbi:MAG: flagellar motor protein MotB [Geobacter sp.]|nr:MAG: flagellar motor protein MotB [Geobacter sp.]